MSEEVTQRKHFAEIDGCQYLINPENGIAVRNIPPGGNPGRNWHVKVPHPDPEKRARGWSIVIIFLPVLVAVGAYMLGFLP